MIECSDVWDSCDAFANTGHLPKADKVNVTGSSFFEIENSILYCL